MPSRDDSPSAAGHRRRVAILTEIPAPYRVPLFSALAARLDIEERVFFLAPRDPKRPYPLETHEFRFDWRILPRLDLTWGDRWIVVNRGVLRTLASFRPDVVVVGGWNQPAFWSALIYTRAQRLPLVAWVESTARDARSGKARLELGKRLFLRACSAVLVPGRASRAYLRELDVPDARIVDAPNAVDADIFATGIAELRQDRATLRRELGLDSCTFLYVGRFDPEKGLDTLLDAIDGVPGELVLVGSGSLQAELERRVASSDQTRIVGWLPAAGLARWYAAADVFVLPSRSEQWGMVLSEAANAGLPLVATEATGAAHDLIEHGANGFRVPIDDVAALRRALTRLAEDPEFRLRAGLRSRELAAPFTSDAWAEAVARVTACLVETNRSGRRVAD
jgi:glycosyltransferase involved in cell wall biosynthesis